MQRWILFGLLLLLAACSSEKATNPPETPILGLLKVTITGVGEGATADAKAEWVKGGVSGQSATIVPVTGTSALNDVQFSRGTVNFSDDDRTSTRYVFSTFDLTNRTTVSFANLTLYAVNVLTNIGGTAIANMTDGTGTLISDVGVARGFQPTHGMRSSGVSFVTNPDISDLQFFTPSEASSIKNQSFPSILPSTATVLEMALWPAT